MDHSLTEDRIAEIPSIKCSCGWWRAGLFRQSAARAHVLGAQTAHIREVVQENHNMVEVGDSDGGFIRCSCGWNSIGQRFHMRSARRHMSRAKKLVTLNNGL